MITITSNQRSLFNQELTTMTVNCDQQVSVKVINRDGEEQLEEINKNVFKLSKEVCVDEVLEESLRSVYYFDGFASLLKKEDIGFSLTFTKVDNLRLNLVATEEEEFLSKLIECKPNKVQCLNSVNDKIIELIKPFRIECLDYSKNTESILDLIDTTHIREIIYCGNEIEIPDKLPPNFEKISYVCDRNRSVFDWNIEELSEVIDHFNGMGVTVRLTNYESVEFIPHSFGVETKFNLYVNPLNEYVEYVPKIKQLLDRYNQLISVEVSNEVPDVSKDTLNSIPSSDLNIYKFISSNNETSIVVTFDEVLDLFKRNLKVKSANK